MSGSSFLKVFLRFIHIVTCHSVSRYMNTLIWSFILEHLYSLQVYWPWIKLWWTFSVSHYIDMLLLLRHKHHYWPHFIMELYRLFIYSWFKPCISIYISCSYTCIHVPIDREHQILQVFLSDYNCVFVSLVMSLKWNSKLKFLSQSLPV